MRVDAAQDAGQPFMTYLTLQATDAYCQKVERLAAAFCRNRRLDPAWAGSERSKILANILGSHENLTETRR